MSEELADAGSASAERAEQPAAGQSSEQSMLDERLGLLALALFWAAGLVFVLSLIWALTVISTNVTFGTVLPEDVERQGRGLVAVAALGVGFTSAGVLAGLGGILWALLRRNGD